VEQPQKKLNFQQKFQECSTIEAGVGDAPATTGIYRVGTDGLTIGESNQHTNSPFSFFEFQLTKLTVEG